MDKQEELDYKREILTELKRRKYRRDIQFAKYGDLADPSIVNERDDLAKEIAKVEAEIQALETAIDPLITRVPDKSEAPVNLRGVTEAPVVSERVTEAPVVSERVTEAPIRQVFPERVPEAPVSKNNTNKVDNESTNGIGTSLLLFVIAVISITVGMYFAWNILNALQPSGVFLPILVYLFTTIVVGIISMYAITGVIIYILKLVTHHIKSDKI